VAIKVKNNQMENIIAEQYVNNYSALVEALKLVASGGVGAAIIGLLGKLWVDSKLERAKANYEKDIANLKAKLAQKQTIHKLQFEKEFSIYLELWKALVRLRNTSADLVRRSEFITSKETPEQRRDRKDKEFKDSYNELIQLVEDQQPFYAKEVYEKASKILSESWKQSINVILLNLQPEYYVKEEERFKEILRVIAGIESSIRERIGLISSAELVE
jgi:hypothetical protein